MKQPLSQRAIVISVFALVLGLNAAFGTAVLISQGFGLESPWRSLTLGFSLQVTLFALYLRGWDPARFVFALLATFFSTISLPAERYTHGFPLGLIVPVLLSAMITDWRGILASGIGVVVVALLKVGPATILSVPNTAAVYALCVVGIMLLRLTEDAFRKSAEDGEARYRTIVSNLPVIVYALDRDGRLTLADGAALALIGSEPGLVVGQNFFDLFSEYPEAVAAVKKTLSGSPTATELELEGRVFASYTNPHRGRDGEVSGAGGVAMDVTERRRAQDEVDRLNKNLESIVAERTAQLRDALEELKRTQNSLILSEKMVALGQLVSGIAHEVNTPLGAIASSARSMLDELSTRLSPVMEGYSAMGEADRSSLAHMLKSALDNTDPPEPAEERRRRRIIQKILADAGMEESASLAADLALIGDETTAERVAPLAAEAKNAELLRSACALAAALKSGRIIEAAVEQASRAIKALRLFSHQGHAKGVVPVDVRSQLDEILVLFRNKLKHGVEVRATYAQNSVVQGRGDELSQVWTNLINNALQAMQYQGRLELTTEDCGSMLAVAVGDTGGGIPADIRERIFEPFFTTKGSGEGTGLGLDIARRVVEAHGGTIDFQSEPGHTVFTVTLPRRRNEQD